MPAGGSGYQCDPHHQHRTQEGKAPLLPPFRNPGPHGESYNDTEDRESQQTLDRIPDEEF